MIAYQAELITLNLPEFGLPSVEPTIPARVYRERMNSFRQRVLAERGGRLCRMSLACSSTGSAAVFEYPGLSAAILAIAPAGDAPEVTGCVYARSCFVHPPIISRRKPLPLLQKS